MDPHVDSYDGGPHLHAGNFLAQAVARTEAGTLPYSRFYSTPGIHELGELQDDSQVAGDRLPEGCNPEDYRDLLLEDCSLVGCMSL